MFKRLFRQKAAPPTEPQSYIDDQPTPIARALQSLHEMTEENCRESAGVCWEEFLGSFAMIVREQTGHRPASLSTESDVFYEAVRRAFAMNDFDVSELFPGVENE